MNFIQRMMTREYKKRPSVKTLLKHPRLKSMMKKRREAAENGLPVEGRLIPIIPDTPESISVTPPRCDSPSSLVNDSLVLPTTPPTGFSTPNISIFNRRIE